MQPANDITTTKIIWVGIGWVGWGESGSSRVCWSELFFNNELSYSLGQAGREHIHLRRPHPHVRGSVPAPAGRSSALLGRSPQLGS